LIWGPVVKHMPLWSQPTNQFDEHVPKENLQTQYGYSNTDWDMDIRHRCSISGMVFFLAGTVFALKTRVQPTVALGTAESKFLAASDTDCLGLFISVLLDELLQHQRAATTVYEDNDACRMITDWTAPTCQMRHITIIDFELQDWTERNVITLTVRASHANASDFFTKQVGNILFAHHNDHISSWTKFFRINSDVWGQEGVIVPAGGVWSAWIPATPFKIHSLE
jgi:hypothetical protein